MLETSIEFLQSLPWIWVLVFAFAVTFIENVFPPSPSDTIVVFMGSLLGGFYLGGFSSLLIASTLGSVFGFLAMYMLGLKFEKRIIESGKFKFISRKVIVKVELWFRKWGYSLIVANRFLSGTRAVIAFVAGMSELSISKTLVLSALSAALWNSILISLGIAFSSQWQRVDYYMSIYGKILAPIGVLIIIIYIIYMYIKKRKAKLGNE